MLNYLGYLSYRLGEALVSPLSMEGAYRLAERLAGLFWLFQRRSRRILLANLRQVLPPTADEETLRKTARTGFVHFAYGLADFFRLPRLLGGELEDLIVGAPGLDQVREAVASGTGAVLMIAHMGPWEAAGAWMARRGLPVTAVALPHAGKIDEFFVSRRQRSGYRSVPLGRAARELLQALKRGETIAVAADRNFDEFGTVVEFFGRPARLPDGHVRIALRTGAPIVPTFVIRSLDKTVQIIFESPIFLHRGADDLSVGMRRCLDVMERYIRRWPEQWMAFSPVWAGD